MFIPSYPLFSGFFLWVARLGAALFTVLQQVILIDIAYNWNDDWVERANEGDRLSFGTGSGWLQAIVGVYAANPTVGNVNMPILGVAQWLAIGLYSWTLIAPRVYPDRDFS